LVLQSVELIRCTVILLFRSMRNWSKDLQPEFWFLFLFGFFSPPTAEFHSSVSSSGKVNRSQSVICDSFQDSLVSIVILLTTDLTALEQAYFFLHLSVSHLSIN